MNIGLKLETILDYLKSIYGCEIFQHSESFNSFYIACFRKGSAYPTHKFIVHRWADEEFSPDVLARINEYDRRNHPEWEVIKVEEINESAVETVTARN